MSGADSAVHLEVLRRVTEHIAVGQRLDEVLQTITHGLVQIAGVASCVVSLYITDDECDVCRHLPLERRNPARRLHRYTQAAAGDANPDAEIHTLPLGTFFTGAAAEQRRVLRLDRLPERLEEIIASRPGPENVRQVEWMRAHGITDGVFYPLLLHDEMVGALSLMARREIGEEEAGYLGIFALQAASAIRAAQLYRDVERLKDRLAEENAYLQSAVEEEGGFAGIVGRSEGVRRVLRLVRQVAPGDSTVLITGETGTGKELVARAIHHASQRADHPLIKVNCGAITAGLVESELFGHEKGAFTGALQRRIGRFELAHRGTLFLDEIGELPPEVQVKILRVLQEREFERVGGERAVEVDVRLIAATHRDLSADVAAGRFRSDLFYRLNVFPIAVPALRDRGEDIPMLAAHFLAHFARKLQKPVTALTPASLARLQAYSWPGNIRELQNVLERACVLAEGPRVEVPDLVPPRGEAGGPSGRPRTLEAIERDHIVAVLADTGGRIEGAGGAAAILGLRPSTLRSRMGRLGIRRSGARQG
jgi:formate hydrogenlyase transcriptional activator